MTVGEILKNINDNYSAVLSAFTSIVMVVITMIYVVFTFLQVRASRKAVEVSTTQMKLSSVPCVIVNSVEGFGSPVFEKNKYGRRQMGFDIILKNCSTEPALSIYILAKIVLKNIKVEASKEIIMDCPILYFPYLEQGKKDNIHVKFEANAINYLIKDLEYPLTHAKYDNCFEELYNRADFALEIYYQNTMGQWFLAVYSEQIFDLWGREIKQGDSVIDNIRDYDDKSVRIPGNELTDNMSFKVRLAGQKNGFSKYDLRVINEIMAKAIIDKYDGYKGLLHVNMVNTKWKQQSKM